jgi:Protein of unknown function (DUF3626)
VRHLYSEALAHVAGAADGGDPTDPSWRVTLHFHPDRLAGGAPILERMAVRQRRIGGSPRFGSAHLRLTAGTLARATFCYPDSASEPAHFGIATRIAPLVKLAEADDSDPLDDYIEAHVHGPEFARLGASLARGGALTPRLIGDASRAGRNDEQALKRVWHYAARFGSLEMAGGL